MGFFSKMMGGSRLEGRVSSLHDRANALVLPHCNKCGFGIMRVQLPTGDEFEEKLDLGQTRLRCDRADCGCVVVVNSREAVPA